MHTPWTVFFLKSESLEEKHNYSIYLHYRLFYSYENAKITYRNLKKNQTNTKTNKKQKQKNPSLKNPKQSHKLKRN